MQANNYCHASRQVEFDILEEAFYVENYDI